MPGTEEHPAAITRVKTLAVVISVCFFLAAGARAASPQALGFNMTDEVKELVTQAIPPYVGDVEMSPEKPAAGEEVTITASVGMVQLTKEETTMIADATLFYTTDGGETWNEESMDQDSENPEVWTAEIPGQEAGVTVEYYIKAESDVGTLSFTAQNREIDLAVGTTQNFGLTKSMNLAGYDADDPEDSPFEHLAVVVAEPEPDENATSLTDISEMRVGRDEENYYIRLKFGAKIDSGALSPFVARLYLGFFLNLSGFPEYNAKKAGLKDFVDEVQKLFPLQDKYSMMEKGAKRIFAWFWAPIVDVIPVPIPGVGKIPPEGLIKVDPSNTQVPIAFDTQSAKTVIRDDGTVDITIQRAALGDDTDTMMMFFGDIQVDGTSLGDFKNMKIKIPDITFPTILKFTDYKYTVAE